MESDGKIVPSLPPVPPPAPTATVSGSNNAFPQARPMHGRISGPTRRSTRGQWTPEEDEILRAAVQRFKGKNWKKIAESFKDRTDVQCLHRWQKVLNPDLIKGPWSKEEDEIIVQMVKKYGPKKWSTIAQHLPGRIGKQCRERWHNHLNPGINKEAWTQEEELVLIHAHELYGNKWAELTKYLPGRTDNAIKNHWNSSVKKKLDSYKASGLLAQLQDLTLINHQNQSTSASGLRVQQSSEDGEEISECSQVGCSQTSDMSNAVCQTREDFIVSEESDHGKTQNMSPTASCSEQYYPSLDDITFTISDIPCEFTCSTNYLEEDFSKVSESETSDFVFGTISLPMDSSSNLTLGNYFLAAPSHNTVPETPHQSVDYRVAASVNDCGNDADVVGQIPRPEQGRSQIILTQEEADANMERYNDYMCFQSIYQFAETEGAVALQSYNDGSSVLEASNCDNLPSIPSTITGQNESTIGDMNLGQINDGLPSLGPEFGVNTEEGCVNANNSRSPCHDPLHAGFTEQTDLSDSSRSIPVNTFVSETSDDQQITTPIVKQPVLRKREQEAGTLCYEPPRFPSLDIPFFSCDLAQSGTDAQHDYSPLGIRQLMMSASSLTPFKLWDSPPSSDDSPDALLKSAAKTFARTPSILKKRHRDLLSPLSPFSERRFDKKTGNDINQGFLCTSRLTKEFSRLDVIFDETVPCKESSSSLNNPKDHTNSSIDDKENACPNYNHEFEAKTPKGGALSKNIDNMDEGTPDQNSKLKFYEDGASETTRGVLVELDFNEVELSSPVGIRHNAGLETCVRSAEVANLKNTSKEATVSESPFGNVGSYDQMKQNGSKVSPSGQPVSGVTKIMVDSLVNEVGAENLNFFGGTPFRRSMESPSAWKSPWYFSSLVSCPRFEPDITIEDIGIFMSPGERSFDAIGLMKQINEQGADTYADAREILGSETPESILRQRCSNKLNSEGESSNVADSELEGRPQITTNVLTERRVLDFSECGTPVKSTEKMKCVGGQSL
ncbi:hypothetical protein RND81_08G200400 [Saponaria officinalis]|uniref:Uncharacterized protein n=1 Tax=Saponaria officinalis TaxID=3572 RepID=A0AAW1JC62_SAPOF